MTCPPTATGMPGSPTFPQGDIEVAVADTLSSPDADRSADGRLDATGLDSSATRVETLADHAPRCGSSVTKVRLLPSSAAQRAGCGRTPTTPTTGASCGVLPCSGSWPSPRWPSARRCRARRSSWRCPGPGSSGCRRPTSRRRPAFMLFGLVAVYGGLVLLMRVWYGMTKALARRPGVPVKYLWLDPRAVDGPDAGRRPDLQPRRLLVRRPGRDDEPPHQPVQLRARSPSARART